METQNTSKAPFNRSTDLDQALLHTATIIDNSDDAILTKTLAGRVISWNKGAEKLYGYASNEVVGKSVSVIFPRDRKKELRDIQASLKTGKKVEHYETLRLTKDGRLINVSVTISPIRNASGIVIGALTISRDITDRKVTEENTQFLYDAGKLLSSSLDIEKTLQSVVKLAVPYVAEWCGVYLLTDQKEIKTVGVGHINPKKVSWAQKLAYKYPSSLKDPSGVGKVISTGKPEMVKEFQLEEALVQLRNQYQDPELEKLLRILNIGSYMIVPIKNKNQVLGAIIFTSNKAGRNYKQADLKLAEELANRVAVAIERSHLYEQARQAVRLRDQFISLASHELKTPLTSLKVYNKIVERELEKTDKRDLLKYTNRIDRQVDRLASLVYELLDVTKIERGKLELAQEPVDLKKLIKENTELMQKAVEDRQIKTTISINSTVIGDYNRLSQVLINLIENAIKYSPGKNKVDVKAAERNGTVVVSVRDYGIGLEKSDQDKIFDRFFQTDNPDRKTFPGLGLGLYISREIISRHGGEVKVKSKLGKGSTFYFTLPKLAGQTKKEGHHDYD